MDKRVKNRHIFTTKELIKEIKKSRDETVVLCGASSRAKYLIKSSNLYSHIDFVLDNYSDKKEFENIPIIRFEKLSEIENKLFIFCGMRQVDFFEQLKSIKNSKYIFEFNRNGSLPLFFEKDFFFEVEVPNFQSGFGIENRNIFATKLINSLLFFNQKITTTPISPSNDQFLKKRIAKPNSMLFSYHGIGEKSPRKVHYKEGYFFDLISFDQMGYGGWSSLCIDVKELENIKNISIKKAEKDFLYYKKKYIDKNLSKYAQPEIENIKLPKKFVFIPLQIFTDSVMQKSYFDPMFWFKQIVSILTDQDIDIVIKRHPRCDIEDVENELDRLKTQSNITIYDGSIHKAIEKCDAVYTINSGVGFESLFHLKPVVTFGAVDYQSATLNIKDFKDLENNIIPVLSENKINYIKQFLSYSIKEKNINISSNKSIDNLVDTIVINNIKTTLEKI